MFGGYPGPWRTDPPWNGWWGDNPPYHVPVFVVTHHARASVEMQGGTTFHFVTGGIASALEQARAAAGAKDIVLAGGAGLIQQFLAAGHVDEVNVSIAPMLLGSGERLFDRVPPDPARTGPRDRRAERHAHQVSRREPLTAITSRCETTVPARPWSRRRRGHRTRCTPPRPRSRAWPRSRTGYPRRGCRRTACGTRRSRSRSRR